MTDAKPSSENVARTIATTGVVHRLPTGATRAEIVAVAHKADADDLVVLGDSADALTVAGGRRRRPADHEIVAQCRTMTDAIKHVDGAIVRETVDRTQLRAVGFPMVIPVALARKWAASVASAWDSASEAEMDSSGAVDVARLLSEFNAVEPDLIVVDLEQTV